MMWSPVLRRLLELSQAALLLGLCLGALVGCASAGSASVVTSVRRAPDLPYVDEGAEDHVP